MEKKITRLPKEAKIIEKQEIEAKICPECGRRDSRIIFIDRGLLPWSSIKKHYECRNQTCKCRWVVTF